VRVLPPLDARAGAREALFATGALLSMLLVGKHLARAVGFGEVWFTAIAAFQLYVPLWLVQRRGEAPEAYALHAHGLILDDRSGPPSDFNRRFLLATAPWMTPVHSIAYQHGTYSPMRAFGSVQFWDVPSLEPADRKFRGPIVVLTAGDKQNSGDSLAVWLPIKRPAGFVGERDNGAPGNPSRWDLSGRKHLGGLPLAGAAPREVTA